MRLCSLIEGRSIMTQLPHAFRRIRLELARSKEFPNGSANHGYEFIAPLDPDAHIDALLWQKYRENCRVTRFWGDGEEIGYLLHKPGGTRARALGLRLPQDNTT
jgi:hypothetical protein